MNNRIETATIDWDKINREDEANGRITLEVRRDDGVMIANPLNPKYAQYRKEAPPSKPKSNKKFHLKTLDWDEINREYADAERDGKKIVVLAAQGLPNVIVTNPMNPKYIGHWDELDRDEVEGGGLIMVVGENS
jgi:hypothetical protein